MIFRVNSVYGSEKCLWRTEGKRVKGYLRIGIPWWISVKNPPVMQETE